MQSRTLGDLCKDNIGKFTGEQFGFFSNALTNHQRYLLASILPLDLPLKLTLTLNLDEEYWRRKCFLNKWNRINYWLCDCLWRETFLRHYAERLIDNFIAQQITFPEVENSLSSIRNSLHSLTINGYKFNYADFSDENIHSKESILTLERNIIRLANWFPNLEEISFYNLPINIELFEGGGYETPNKLHGEMFSETLLGRKSLKKLSLIGTPSKYVNMSPLITDLLHLNLIDLNLSCDQIGDDLCGPLSKLIQQTQLRSLTLSSNNITRVGAQQIASALRDHKSLRVLKLDRNLITDEGVVSMVQSLVSNKGLLELDMAYNKIGPECSCSFRVLLMHNSILQSLNLAANNLGKEFGRVLYEALQVNNTILTLSCQFCGFDQETEDLIHLRLLENYQAYISLKQY